MAGSFTLPSSEAALFPLFPSFFSPAAPRPFKLHTNLPGAPTTPDGKRVAYDQRPFRVPDPFHSYFVPLETPSKRRYTPFTWSVCARLTPYFTLFENRNILSDHWHLSPTVSPSKRSVRASMGISNPWKRRRSGEDKGLGSEDPSDRCPHITLSTPVALMMSIVRVSPDFAPRVSIRIESNRVHNRVKKAPSAATPRSEVRPGPMSKTLSCKSSDLLLRSNLFTRSNPIPSQKKKKGLGTHRTFFFFFFSSMRSASDSSLD